MNEASDTKTTCNGCQYAHCMQAYLQCQARFAHAGRASQRNQPHTGLMQQMQDLLTSCWRPTKVFTGAGAK